ncbi:MAG: hypothetical protein R3308_06580 [Thiohalobacterales bacterium]|nr:hypothetical protein [Thiohalobacterales bacterium]
MKYLAVILLLIAGPGVALELDDTLSPVQNIDMQVDWTHRYRLDELSEDQLNALEAHYDNYELRLNTSSYVGRRVRIYLALPVTIRGLDDPGALRLSWTTRGDFVDGTVTPGSRTLMFDGTVDDVVLVDILDFTLEIDSRAFSAPINFEPDYEIEIVTP